MTSFLLFGTASLVHGTIAQGSAQDKVPTPFIVEIHNYNNNAGNEYQHEYWAYTMKCGDMLLNLIADNASRKDSLGNYQPASVTYQQNMQYFVKNINYIASLQIFDITFSIGGQVITTVLTNCANFTVTHSAITYNGMVPGFDCNITFNKVQLYPGAGRGSTFDLTMIHHVDINWTQSNITTEALFDFTGTRFYQSGSGEFVPGTPFTTEIHYGMSLWDQTDNRGIVPSGHTNTSLNYDITRDNGLPLTVAKLNMNNNFTVRNGSGNVPLVGYSYMSFDARNPQSATVTHGFPGLFYMDVATMRSDPTIQVTYDRISTAPDYATLATEIVIPSIGAVAIICVVVVMKKRKSRMDRNLPAH